MSSHMCFSLQKGLFPSDFLTKIVYAFPICRVLHSSPFLYYLFDPNNVLCNILNMLIVCSGNLVHWSTPKMDYHSFWVCATACPIYSQHPSTCGGYLHLQSKDVAHHANKSWLKCLKFWLLTFLLLWLKYLVMYTL